MTVDQCIHGKRTGLAAVMAFAAMLLVACDGAGVAGSGGGRSDVPPENFTLSFTTPESEQIGYEGCPDFYVNDVTEQLRYISYNSGGTWEDMEVTAEQGDKRAGGLTCVFTVKNMGVDGRYGALNNLTITTLGVGGDLTGFDEQAHREWVYNRSGSTLDTVEGVQGISRPSDDGVKMAQQSGLGAPRVNVGPDRILIRFHSDTSALITGFERSSVSRRGGWALVETGDPQNPNYIGETSASQLARVFADSFVAQVTYNRDFWKD